MSLTEKLYNFRLAQRKERHPSAYFKWADLPLCCREEWEEFAAFAKQSCNEYSETAPNGLRKQTKE